MVGKGMKVCFRSKVFKPPYTPYYDAYKGHAFEVVNIRAHDHIELKCVSDPTLKVAGLVHDDELKRFN